ncbi:MAG TPA: glycosyltransferase family 4 protein, partial [Terriglobales bacterium]
KRWYSNLRWVYRFLPFARSTYRDASAIIAASSQVCSEFASYQDKLFFVPEPGISAAICSGERLEKRSDGKAELIFVAGLTPNKGCDLALRAAAPLLRNGSAHFTILGDGPERSRLEQLAKSLEIDQAVSFCGWVPHDEVFRRLRSADIMVFPSVRDNGAGAVFEALACGAVPVVADFGGPGDIVHQDVGRKMSLTNESDFVAQMERALTELVNDRNLLEQLRKQCMTYARERLTWDAKAKDTTQVLNWVLRQGPKPDFRSPKALDVVSSRGKKLLH